MADYEDPRPTSQGVGSTEGIVLKDNLITLDTVINAESGTEITNRKGETITPIVDIVDGAQSVVQVAVDAVAADTIQNTVDIESLEELSKSGIMFATIADIDAGISTGGEVSLSIGDSIAVEDYATGNDSGVLFFKVVADNGQSDDGGKNIYLPTAGLWLEQNIHRDNSVKAWGAVGDDSTDNTASFVNANNYMSPTTTSKVTIPDGIFRLAQGTLLKTTGDGQNFVGESKANSIIVYGTIQLAHSNCSARNFRMYAPEEYGILVDDDRTETERKSSYSTRYGALIENVNIGGKTHGVALTDTGFFTRITGSHLSGNVNGLWLANDQSVSTPLYTASWDRGDTILSENTIASNSDYGILARNHGTLIMGNNKVIGNGVNLAAIPDNTDGRDERVMQVFSSNNSLENAMSIREYVITGVVDNGNGLARFTTSTAHLLPETHVYSGEISGTTAYDNDDVKITYVSTTEFDTEQAYIATDTGTLELPGWDLYVAPVASGSAAYWNIRGGDINQYNIESAANANISGVNVKFQRRYGSGIDSLNDTALINGTDRTDVNDPINIFPSGDYTDSELFGKYTLLNGANWFTSGVYIAHRNADATGANKRPSTADGIGNIFSGTYIPDQVSSNSNVTSVTFNTATYFRIGNTANVTGSLTVTPTIAADQFTAVRFDIPVFSAFSGSTELSGVASCSDFDYAGVISAAIQSDSVNDCAYMVFKAQTTDATTLRYNFSYTVK